MIDSEWQPIVVVDGQDNHHMKWDPKSGDWGTMLGKVILARRIDVGSLFLYHYDNIEQYRQIVGCNSEVFVEIHPDYMPTSLRYAQSVIMCGHMFHTD